MRATVLLVSQNVRTIGILELILRDDGFSVTTVQNGAAATGILLENPPDLILLDLAMTPVSGLHLLDSWRAAGLDCACIVLSARVDRDEQVQAFAHGVDDFIGMPFEPRILLARVHNVLRRMLSSLPTAMRTTITVGDARLSLNTRSFIGRSGQPVKLSPIEMKLLMALMEQPGKALSRAMLLERVWGSGWHDPNRVDVSIRRLRLKIESNPLQPRYLQSVRATGYAFIEANERDEPLTSSTQLG